MSYIMMGLGWVLKLMYMLCSNYGVALILFTIIVKAILFPLTLKQQKSMMKTQKLQPILNELQQKYGNDKEKLNQETMKIYQKYKINPMSGCLPLLIQLPILLALYWVVRQPMVYIMGFGESEVWRAINAIEEFSATNPDAVNALLPSMNIEGFNVFRDANYSNFGMYEIQVARFLQDYPDVMNSPWITEMGRNILVLNFDFLGIDLSQTPDLWSIVGLITGNIPENFGWSTVGLWLIAILSGVSAYASSKISQALQPQQQPQVDENGVEKANPMKTMMIIMPIFSAWIAFTLPAAIGFYWVLSNVIQIIQQVVITKFASVDISDEEIEGEILNAKKNRKKRKK